MKIDTQSMGPDDFQSSFPAGAAHAASDIGQDDYADAMPEGWFSAALFVIGILALAAVFA